eukprot:2440179-Amphidinium_carterae.1
MLQALEAELKIVVKTFVSVSQTCYRNDLVWDLVARRECMETHHYRYKMRRSIAVQGDPTIH